MAKPEQVLIIDPPHELKFKGPFSVPVTSYMKLLNPTDKRVVFKIKTTVPKKYCVRPNSGILDPNESIELAICLQPFVFEPTEKNKHKFMVQSMYAPEGDCNLEQIWRNINPGTLMDSKLKCVFEIPPEDNEMTAGNATLPLGVPESETKLSTSGTNVTAPMHRPNATTAFTNAESGKNDGHLSSLEVELAKAAQEVKQLREEESNLRRENLRLREELIAAKHAANTDVERKYSPSAHMADNPNDKMMRIAFSVLVVFIGILIGKFIV